MKPSTMLFAAACAALLAVSTTAWPFHPHPIFPFPPRGGSAPPPSSGGGGFPSFPPVGDMTKCMQAVHGGGSAACSPLSYDGGSCCAYLSGLAESCTYIPYYKSPMFQGIVSHVCDSGSSPSPPSS